ncbi:hypothetical protein DL96DRAFT_1667706 [Flagelloscypha sp. PMI_526]|nr:hypothetical protein DL96DRAFT_1667706 [Flagelloscypha sp. PMI_526]
MPSKTRLQKCQFCSTEDSKYSCPSCRVPYCSVACFKGHKGRDKSYFSSFLCLSRSLPTTSSTSSVQTTEAVSMDNVNIQDVPPLRPLTTLKWPYVPEESAFPDPLARDDPKPLQTRQYEAIATSENLREILSENPKLKEMLINIDKLRGREREDALQRALGVSAHDLNTRTGNVPLDEDTLTLRRFAETVENAVRGEKTDSLGLDWGE